MSEVGEVLDLDAPETWPRDLLDLLHHYWGDEAPELNGLGFDLADSNLRTVLNKYSVVGWHCTRLTDREASVIITSGLHLPNLETLTKRLDLLVRSGEISISLADHLKTHNQAGDENRAGMLHFCFFPPRLAGESGIGRFFRYWGGEALYNSHQNDPVVEPILRTIGTPRLIEARFSISNLARWGSTSGTVLRRFQSRDKFRLGDAAGCEDRIKNLSPPPIIQRILTYPEAEFIELTRCNTWLNFTDLAGAL